MNCFQGFTHPVPGGHHAMLRFAEDGQAEPVKGTGGKPIVYPTELEALRAVTEHLLRYVNGNLRRDGDKATSVRAAAEAHFIKQKGKTRRIDVSVKGAVRSPRKGQDGRGAVLMKMDGSEA